MRSPLDMETCQIEITNYCHNQCSNCTRLCGHHAKPYHMDMDTFKKAVDSMVGYPKMVGIMGGEPILNPNFVEMCEYAASKIPFHQLGLWTCLPKGFEHYREVICKTFAHIFINDHTRNDILHGPVLVASDEMQMEDWRKHYLIDKCWVQNTWSACINPRGAWFCEVAGALAMLLEVENLGWPVEQGWWLRSPVHFRQQMEMCKFCGCAMPLKRRVSTETVDDISPRMLKVLEEVSPKIKAGKYVVNDCKPYEGTEGELCTYKDQNYRDAIAARYGIFLMPNNMQFLSPMLAKGWKGDKK